MTTEVKASVRNVSAGPLGVAFRVDGPLTPRVHVATHIRPGLADAAERARLRRRADARRRRARGGVPGAAEVEASAVYASTKAVYVSIPQGVCGRETRVHREATASGRGRSHPAGAGRAR
jgi:hypothetical protein